MELMLILLLADSFVYRIEHMPTEVLHQHRSALQLNRARKQRSHIQQIIDHFQKVVALLLNALQRAFLLLADKPKATIGECFAERQNDGERRAEFMADIL